MKWSLLLLCCVLLSGCGLLFDAADAVADAGVDADAGADCLVLVDDEFLEADLGVNWDRTPNGVSSQGGVLTIGSAPASPGYADITGRNYLTHPGLELTVYFERIVSTPSAEDTDVTITLEDEGEISGFEVTIFGNDVETKTTLGDDSTVGCASCRVDPTRAFAIRILLRENTVSYQHQKVGTLLWEDFAMGSPDSINPPPALTLTPRIASYTGGQNAVTASVDRVTIRRCPIE